MRVYLSILFVALLGGVTGPIMALSYFQGRQVALAGAEQRMSLTSQRVIDLYRDVINDGFLVIRLTAAAEARRASVAENLDGATPFLIAAVEASPFVASAYIGYANGDFVQAASVEQNPGWLAATGAPPQTRWVLRLIERSKSRVQWRFLDQEKKLIGEKPGDLATYDPRQRVWHQLAVRQNGPVAVGPYATAATNSLTLTLATPLVGRRADVVGVDVLLSAIHKALGENPVSENAHGLVLDVAGRLIVHSDPALQALVLERSKGRDESSFADPLTEASRDALRNLAGKDGSIAIKVKGETWVARVATIDFPGGMSQNTLVIAAPISDFSGPGLELLKKNIGLTAFLSSIGVALSLLISRLVSSTLLSLSESARRIGDLDFIAAPQRASWITEINTLSAALASARATITTFALYVPRELVRKIISAGQANAGRAVRQEVTALFTDIRDFTTISEERPPEEVVALLSNYFEMLNDVVTAHHGVIVQYLGDSIYAMWNAPQPDPDHVDDACACALALEASIAAFNTRQRVKGEPELVTRIGLHTGVTVVGSVGASSRLQYTAMGDTVNVASRLEGMNKQFGTTILVSAAIRDKCQKLFTFRPLGLAEAKGRHEKLEVFELRA